MWGFVMVHGLDDDAKRLPVYMFFDFGKYLAVFLYFFYRFLGADRNGRNSYRVQGARDLCIYPTGEKQR